MKEYQPMKTSEIIRRLDIMAESGGMLTKDRIRAVREASAKIREQDEAIRILMENQNTDDGFPITGGDSE